MTRLLVTGAAGFIGSFVAERLLQRGDDVVGVDNLSPYYDPALKQARLERLAQYPNFRFVRLDLSERVALETLFGADRPAGAVHLAAQAGVRYSLTNPDAYIDSNIVGFLSVLEACRDHEVAHLVYASTSSVYGLNTNQPFSEHRGADHPVSLYGATKRANELMAHSYSHLFGIPMTGLRFFTVYGPWGRPDMAAFLFTRAILAGEPIDVYNGGRMRRDFTYIDDIVEGVVRVLDRPATANPDWSGDAPDPATSSAPHRIYNIGNSQPVELNEMIATLERLLGREAVRNELPLQPGDVLSTAADTSDLERDFGFRPSTPLAVGLERFVSWYRGYYGV
jgi:UDP-glucuronate 4-epimerase